MSRIIAEKLCKSYPVAIKESGIIGTINHFFRRKYRNINAVQDVTFTIEPGEV
ncbi:MAG: ABC transporter, partial [Dolichospermum sp.]